MAGPLPILSRINEQVVNPLITLLFVTAFVYFLWGLVQFVRSAETDKGQETGKSHIVWGLLGMAIMVSAFGITHFICNTIGVSC